MSAVQYLLDTNAVVEIMRQPLCLVARRLVESGGVSYCAISDITLYELYAGAYASQNVQKNVEAVDRLTQWLHVIPSAQAYKDAARQKASLRSHGQLIEDVDILIGSTAVVTGRVLVSANGKRLSRLKGIQVADWSK